MAFICHVLDLQTDFLENGLSANGLAVTPEHINEDDDRSSHASSSDWTPQPQIGNAELDSCGRCMLF